MDEKYYDIFSKVYSYINDNKMDECRRMIILNSKVFDISLLNKFNNDSKYLYAMEVLIKNMSTDTKCSEERTNNFCDIIVEIFKNFDISNSYNKNLYKSFISLIYQNIDYDHLIDVITHLNNIYEIFNDKEIAYDVFENIIDFANYYDKEYKYTNSIVDYILNSYKYFKDEKFFYLILRKMYLKEPSFNQKFDYYSIDELNDSLNLELKFNENTKEKEFKDIVEYIIERQIFFNRNKERKVNFFDKQVQGANIIIPEIDIPLINYIGYNMKLEKYIINPAIERENEIKRLEVIVISPKHSPLLVGDAGVGKTAIVEGFAYNLQQGNVPEILKDKEIYNLSLSNLIAGARCVGDTEERVSKLVKELKNHKEIIAFIDEIHTMVGAGKGRDSANDVSNALKPYLDRGDIKIIGATTNYEYEKYIMKDKALSRRFNPIFIEEPNKDTTKKILVGSIPYYIEKTGVEYNFNDGDTDILMDHIIDSSDVENQKPDFITKRPEMPLTILEMAFSYAVLESSKELRVEDLYNSIYNEYKLKPEVREESAKMLKKKL